MKPMKTIGGIERMKYPVHRERGLSRIFSLCWLILLASLLAVLPAANGQEQQPLTAVNGNCRVYFNLSVASSGAQATPWLPTQNQPPAGSAGTSLVIDNHQPGCYGWTVESHNHGFSALSLSFQSAPDNAGGTAPGTWSTVAVCGGTECLGVNPIVSTTDTVTTTKTPGAWLRVNLTSKTGTGSVSGVLYGWKVNIVANGGAPVPPVATACGTIGSIQFAGFGGIFDCDPPNFDYMKTALATPGTPVITHSGAAGVSTWGYVVTALSLVGETIASTEGQTTTGNATLTGGNFNIVTTAAVTGSTSCEVWRTTVATSPTTTGRIGSVACGAALNDTGLAGDGASPPASNTTDGLFTSKNVRFSGNESTLTVGPAASTLPQRPFGDNIPAQNPHFFAQSDLLSDVFTAAITAYGNSVNDFADVEAVDAAAFATGNSANAVAATFGAYYDGGANTAAQILGYQGFAHLVSGGATLARGGVFQVDNSGAGVLANARGAEVVSALNLGGGSITNNTGFLVDDQTAGTNNWAIKTGLGRTEFGDNVLNDPVAFINLGTMPNGSWRSCTDCTVTSGVDNTCTAGGAGSTVFAINGVKKCFI